MELKIYNPQVDGFLKSIDWNFDELKEEEEAFWHSLQSGQKPGLLLPEI